MLQDAADENWFVTVGDLDPADCVKLAVLHLCKDRPIDLVVLNCWVTETNDTLHASNSSANFAKSVSDRLSRSIL